MQQLRNYNRKFRAALSMLVIFAFVAFLTLVQMISFPRYFTSYLFTSNSANLTEFNYAQSISSSLSNSYPSTEFSNLSSLTQLSQEYQRQYGDKLLVILLWTSLFARSSWGLDSQGHLPFKQLGCPVSNCFVTNNRSALPTASAVLVNFRDDFNYTDRGPLQRPPHQHWIFFLWESPEHTYDWTWQGNKASPQHLLNFNGFFNWTMTYRLDSDIPFLYGQFKLIENQTRAAKKWKMATAPWKEKSGSVIWMQSNCDTLSHRKQFVQELAKYIDIDVVGNCLKDSSALEEKCTKKSSFEPVSQECSDYLSSTYKFYLATENSLCTDYVTEKFYRAAQLGLVPVVLNGADMSKFSPPHSYIDAQKWASPKELAEFLKKVGSDKILYDSYRWWRPYFSSENYWDEKRFLNMFCDLCAKVTKAHLHPDKYAKVYSDINNWWVSRGRCYDGQTSF